MAIEDLIARRKVAKWQEPLRALAERERSASGRRCIEAALSFIADGWAATALRCGWSEIELVGACPVAPWKRLDRLGAAYGTFTPIAVSAEVILFRAAGRPLRLLRGSQADGAVLPWP